MWAVTRRDEAIFLISLRMAVPVAGDDKILFRPDIRRNKAGCCQDTGTCKPRGAYY